MQIIAFCAVLALESNRFFSGGEVTADGHVIATFIISVSMTIESARFG